jgi:hypothetical protein
MFEYLIVTSGPGAWSGGGHVGAGRIPLPARRTELLELCAHRMTAPHADCPYAHLEDARLARAPASSCLLLT